MSDAGMSCSLGRRQLIWSTSGLLTSLASSALFSDDQSAAASASLVPHFGNAKAKNVIFLMMEGGPSHLDTFDPKPQLTRRHLQQFVRSGRQKSAMEAGQRYYVRSPFRFRRVGQSG
ncbi:MAG: DUF1501 domain-containing protein, partial [Planctomyces sp.]